MKDALTIHRSLLEQEIQHEIVRLPAGIARADELPGALGLPAGRCLATRIFACNDVQSGRRFLAGVIVPAGTEPPAEPVRQATGARLIRPARADLVNSVTEYAADLVCPLLLPDGMPVLVDQGMLDALPLDDVVYTATGEASTALGIRASDLCALSGAKPVRLSGGERPERPERAERSERGERAERRPPWQSKAGLPARRRHGTNPSRANSSST
ncbi:aminoacyl-tRNA deacylase [Actinomadura sp. 21ATH]|uniref:aminoacyl-tRNA deacylase n=1 Tax=Actinomadura sp. 21ATH TaxID=1735444 RepID=UPI0035C10403